VGSETRTAIERPRSWARLKKQEEKIQEDIQIYLKSQRQKKRKIKKLEEWLKCILYRNTASRTYHLHFNREAQKLFFFLVGLEFGTQGFLLAKHPLYHLSHSSSSVCSGYFGDGDFLNYFPGLGLNYSPPNQRFPSS
jgi:hypothetical protein